MPTVILAPNISKNIDDLPVRRIFFPVSSDYSFELLYFRWSDDVIQKAWTLGTMSVTVEMFASSHSPTCLSIT